MVPLFHVSYFHGTHCGAAFSCIVFSCHAVWCRIFMSRIFISRIFSVPYRSYNKFIPCSKIVVSRYSHTKTTLSMFTFATSCHIVRFPLSTLAICCHIVQSRDVSPHNFDDLAMSCLAFSVAPVNSPNY